MLTHYQQQPQMSPAQASEYRKLYPSLRRKQFSEDAGVTQFSVPKRRVPQRTPQRDPESMAGDTGAAVGAVAGGTAGMAAGHLLGPAGVALLGPAGLAGGAWIGEKLARLWHRAKQSGDEETAAALEQAMMEIQEKNAQLPTPAHRVTFSDDDPMTTIFDFPTERPTQFSDERFTAACFAPAFDFHDGGKVDMPCQFGLEEDATQFEHPLGIRDPRPKPYSADSPETGVLALGLARRLRNIAGAGSAIGYATGHPVIGTAGLATAGAFDATANYGARKENRSAALRGMLAEPVMEAPDIRADYHDVPAERMLMNRPLGRGSGHGILASVQRMSGDTTPPPTREQLGLPVADELPEVWTDEDEQRFGELEMIRRRHEAGVRQATPEEMAEYKALAGKNQRLGNPFATGSWGQNVIDQKREQMREAWGLNRPL
jgi:hypothetical protein